MDWRLVLCVLVLFVLVSGFFKAAELIQAEATAAAQSEEGRR